MICGHLGVLFRGLAPSWGEFWPVNPLVAHVQDGCGAQLHPNMPYIYRENGLKWSKMDQISQFLDIFGIFCAYSEILNF
jgi:hypothetical protein